jgi:putative transposase
LQQIKTYQFKIKTTPTLEQTFAKWLGSCRFLYNTFLAYRIDMFDMSKNRTQPITGCSKFDLIKELTNIKKIDEFKWLNDTNAQTLQDVVSRLDKAYQAFFRGFKKGLKVGKPKFTKRDEYKSFALPQGVKILSLNEIQLPKIGKIKIFNKTRQIDGKLKTTNISKKADGWYISFTCECNIEPLPKIESVVGIDVGLTHYVTLSNGVKIDNPKHLQKHERKLKKLQRSLSRKKKGSNNRKKAQAKVAKQHQKIANTRKDFLHRITTGLIRENQAITVEDLQIKNMMQNHKLAKSVQDAAWFTFSLMLEYKSKWYGRSFKKVAARNTSKTCSLCGHVSDKMPLHVREWVCVKCGSIHDRDTNAAKNILKKGSRNQAVGHTVLA